MKFLPIIFFLSFFMTSLSQETAPPIQEIFNIVLDVLSSNLPTQEELDSILPPSQQSNYLEMEYGIGIYIGEDSLIEKLNLALEDYPVSFRPQEDLMPSGGESNNGPYGIGNSIVYSTAPSLKEMANGSFVPVGGIIVLALFDQNTVFPSISGEPYYTYYLQFISQ